MPAPLLESPASEFPIQDLIGLLELKAEALSTALGLVREWLRMGYDTIPAGAAYQLIELGMGDATATHLRMTMGELPGHESFESGVTASA